MKKLIVILSGGASKGAFQAGVWQRIQKEGINFGNGSEKITIPHAVFSISAGALNGALIASGKNKELVSHWNSIAGNPSEVFTSEFLNEESKLDLKKVSEFFLNELSSFQKLGLLFKSNREKYFEKFKEKLDSLKSVASNAPLFDKIQKHINIDDIKSSVFQCGVVSLLDGNYYALKHTDFIRNTEFQKAVLASSSIPIIFPTVDEINTKEIKIISATDGGIRNSTPLGDAVNYVNSLSTDDEFYFLIITTHNGSLLPMKETPNLVNTLSRSIFDIGFNEMAQNDLSEFLRINELVKQAEKQNCVLRTKNERILKAYNVKIIRPERELHSGLNFSRSAIMDSFLHGYLTAEKIIQNPIWD